MDDPSGQVLPPPGDFDSHHGSSTYPKQNPTRPIKQGCAAPPGSKGIAGLTYVPAHLNSLTVLKRITNWHGDTVNWAVSPPILKGDTTPTYNHSILYSFNISSRERLQYSLYPGSINDEPQQTWPPRWEPSFHVDPGSKLPEITILTHWMVHSLYIRDCIASLTFDDSFPSRMPYHIDLLVHYSPTEKGYHLTRPSICWQHLVDAANQTRPTPVPADDSDLNPENLTDPYGDLPDLYEDSSNSTF